MKSQVPFVSLVLWIIMTMCYGYLTKSTRKGERQRKRGRGRRAAGEREGEG